jgi:hypothetical protein
LHWDAHGKTRALSVPGAVVSSDLGVGIGLSRRWQLGASLPVYANWRGTSEPAWGAGPGDARLSATWRALEEGAKAGLVMTVGTRLPTGRSWYQSETASSVDVTGLPGPALTLGVQAERSNGQTPWVPGASTELGAANGTIAPVLTLSGGVGRYLGQRLTLFGTLTHQESLARGTRSWGRGARTSAGGRLIMGKHRWVQSQSARRVAHGTARKIRGPPQAVPGSRSTPTRIHYTKQAYGTVP